MKTLTRVGTNLMIFASIFILVACNSKEKQSDATKEENIIVLVFYKTQPNKSNLAVAALTNLIEEVKGEPHFEDLKLHVDKQDSTNIFLYEVWSNEAYYKEDHMKTEHLQEFITESRNFLASPPEISFWKVEKDF